MDCDGDDDCTFTAMTLSSGTYRGGCMFVLTGWEAEYSAYSLYTHPFKLTRGCYACCTEDKTEGMERKETKQRPSRVCNFCVCSCGEPLVVQFFFA